jgi:hypothetical protein
MKRTSQTAATSATRNLQPSPINPATATDAASYDVVIAGMCGNATSDAATLTVNYLFALCDEPIISIKRPSASEAHSRLATDCPG